MRVFMLGLLALPMLVPDRAAPDEQGPPGLPPQLWRASASQQGGKVVIQLARALAKASRPEQQPAAADVIAWDDLRAVTLGESVRAYGTGGEPLETEAVLEALASPQGVAVFVRIYSFDPPEPPPFYLGLLREGIVVLVVEGKDVYELAP